MASATVQRQGGVMDRWPLVVMLAWMHGQYTQHSAKFAGSKGGVETN